MVNAAELRKGNLLNWNLKLTHPETTLPNETVEVLAVLQEKITYMYPNLENRVEPFEDDKVEVSERTIPSEELEPVPLSDEWLHKAGLEMNGQQVSIRSIHFQWNGKSLEAENVSPQQSFQYLHQLQNYVQNATGAPLDINFNEK